jgi:hypothetical protein
MSKGRLSATRAASDWTMELIGLAMAGEERARRAASHAA